MAVLQKETDLNEQAMILLQKKFDKPYRLTSYIVTLYEGTISEIDVRNFLEAGLRIVRFKMTHFARKDKVVLLSALKKAITWCYRKYLASSWPVAVSIDLPHACIRTGYLKEEINEHRVYIEESKIVEVTSDVKYWNRCDDKRIFIDDCYTLETIKPNTEINIEFGEIKLICTEIVNKLTIKCKVIIGGYLSHGQFVCPRGVKLLRPSFARLDKQLLAFAKEYKLDVVTIHSIRTAKTIEKVRAFFQGSHKPMILTAICEQEGLDNLDDIIAESDGIILAREFLAHSIMNEKRLVTIQLHVGAKCRQLGKPFYVSGNVLEETMKWGTISCNEINDVTNAVLQGAGLVLKTYTDASCVLTTLNLLDSVCKVVESTTIQDNFWRLCLELQPPVTAADAAVLACALIARQSGSVVIVVLTVTGKTAIQLAHLEPEAVILSVSASPRVARKLQLYRGIIPVIYNKKPAKDWHVDMDARIQFAVSYGLHHDLLKYNQTYVILRKADPTSAFCDKVSLWNVIDEENKKIGLVCPEDSMNLASSQLGLLSSIW